MSYHVTRNCPSSRLGKLRGHFGLKRILIGRINQRDSSALLAFLKLLLCNGYHSSHCFEIATA